MTWSMKDDSGIEQEYRIDGELKSSSRAVFELKRGGARIYEFVFEGIWQTQSPSLWGWRPLTVNGKKTKVLTEDLIPQETPIAEFALLVWASFIAAESVNSKFSRAMAKKGSNPFLGAMGNLGALRADNPFAKNFGLIRARDLRESGQKNGDQDPRSSQVQVIPNTFYAASQAQLSQNKTESCQSCSCSCNVKQRVDCSQCGCGNRPHKSEAAATVPSIPPPARWDDRLGHGPGSQPREPRFYPGEGIKHGSAVMDRSPVQDPQFQLRSRLSSVMSTSMESIAPVRRLQDYVGDGPRNAVSTLQSPRRDKNVSRERYHDCGSVAPTKKTCACGAGCGCSASCECESQCHTPREVDVKPACRQQSAVPVSRIADLPVSTPQVRRTFGIVWRVDPEKGARVAADPCDIGHDMNCSVFNPTGKHRLKLPFCGTLEFNVLDCCITHDIDLFCGDQVDWLAPLLPLGLSPVDLAARVIADYEDWIVLTSAKFAACIFARFVEGSAKLHGFCIFYGIILSVFAAIAAVLIAAGMILFVQGFLIRYLAGEQEVRRIIALNHEHDVCCVCGGSQATFCHDPDINPSYCYDECGNQRNICDERCSVGWKACFYSGDPFGSHRLHPNWRHMILSQEQDYPICERCLAQLDTPCPSGLTPMEAQLAQAENRLSRQPEHNMFVVATDHCPSC